MSLSDDQERIFARLSLGMALCEDFVPGIAHQDFGIHRTASALNRGIIMSIIKSGLDTTTKQTLQNTGNRLYLLAQTKEVACLVADHR